MAHIHLLRKFSSLCFQNIANVTTYHRLSCLHSVPSLHHCYLDDDSRLLTGFVASSLPHYNLSLKTNQSPHVNDGSNRVLSHFTQSERSSESTFSPWPPTPSTSVPPYYVSNLTTLLPFPLPRYLHMLPRQGPCTGCSFLLKCLDLCRANFPSSFKSLLSCHWVRVALAHSSPLTLHIPYFPTLFSSFFWHTTEFTYLFYYLVQYHWNINAMRTGN